MTTRDLICFNCKHFKMIDGCVAFDGEIPEEIIRKNKHDKPIKDQKNDLVFQQKEPNENEPI